MTLHEVMAQQQRPGLTFRCHCHECQCDIAKCFHMLAYAAERDVPHEVMRLVLYWMLHVDTLNELHMDAEVKSWERECDALSEAIDCLERQANAYDRFLVKWSECCLADPGAVERLELQAPNADLARVREEEMHLRELRVLATRRHAAAIDKRSATFFRQHRSAFSGHHLTYAFVAAQSDLFVYVLYHSLRWTADDKSYEKNVLLPPRMEPPWQIPKSEPTTRLANRELLQRRLSLKLSPLDAQSFLSLYSILDMDTEQEPRYSFWPASTEWWATGTCIAGTTLEVRWYCSSKCYCIVDIANAAASWVYLQTWGELFQWLIQHEHVARSRYCHQCLRISELDEGYSITSQEEDDGMRYYCSNTCSYKDSIGCAQLAGGFVTAK
jgi:hypothetical protein